MEELNTYIKRVGVKRFAELMGCSDSLIYHVLNGRRGISKQFAQKAEEVSHGFLKKEKLLWN